MIIVESGDCPDDVIEAGEFRVFHEPKYCARLTVWCKEQCPVAETGVLDVVGSRESFHSGLYEGIGGALGSDLFNLEVPLAVSHNFIASVSELLWTPNQAYFLGMSFLANYL